MNFSEKIGPFFNKMIDAGVYNFLYSTNTSIQIVLSLDIWSYIRLDSKRINGSFFSQQIAKIADFNVKTKGFFGGIYFPRQLYFHSELVKFYELVEKLRIPLGVFYKESICANFNATHRGRSSNRIKFITCLVNVEAKQSEPELAAEVTMKTGLDYKISAHLQNIKAEVFIAINYQTESTRHFQRFWCHIVNIAIRNKHYPQVILIPSFNLSTSNTSSWWKVIRNFSAEQDILDETYENLLGVHAIENCFSSCEPCERLLDCCSGFCESIYYMNRELTVCVPDNYKNECLVAFNNTDSYVKENLDTKETNSMKTWLALSTFSLIVVFISAIIAVYAIRVSMRLQVAINSVF